MAVTRAMLMAAGLGTRLRPFTNTCPKALIPLMGVPISQFALDSMADAGISEVVANVHHHVALSSSGLLSLDRGNMSLEISDESALLLGSAGGLKHALPFFDREPFFLVNADVLCSIDLKALARAHELARANFGALITLAVFEKPPEGGRYREILLDRATGRIQGFSAGLEEGRPFFIGSAVIEPEALRGVPTGAPAEFVPTILEPAIRAGAAAFHLTHGIWRDVGGPSEWLSSHLYLIDALETGNLPLHWRRRLDQRNTRLADRAWASKTTEKVARTLRDRGALIGPSYFCSNSSNLSSFEGASVGPRGVLYGRPPVSEVSNAIAFEGSIVERL